MSVKIGTAVAEQGSKAHGVLTVPDAFSDGSSVEVPVFVVNGAKPGPTLHLQTGIHGEEMQSIDSIRRVMTDINPEDLSGVLQYCLPSPLSFRRRCHFLIITENTTGLGRQVNPNRVWPGNPNGSIIEKWVHSIWTNMILDKADCVIDFHTGDGLAGNLNWTMYDELHPRTEELALAFGTEYYIAQRTPPTGISKHMVESQCIEHDIASFAPEGGILGREGLPRIGFDEISVKVCEKGIYNVMKKMGMIEGELELPSKQIVLDRGGAKTIYAEKGGILNMYVIPCQEVEKGAILGRIFSVRTFEEIQTLVAPIDGYVWGLPGYPLKNSGESILSVRPLYKIIYN